MTFIEDNVEHEVSELICLKCLNRWIGVYPSETPLNQLECKCGEIGYVIKTGQIEAYKVEGICEMDTGDEFKLGGIEWTILDTDYQGGVFVLAKEPIEQRAFDDDNCNDWKKASARKYLNEEWRKGFEEKTKVELLKFNRDLTFDNGLKDYGTCFDYVSLITCDEYRRYRDFIPNKSDWWWTLTPWSTPRSGSSNCVRLVYTDGSLNSGYAYYGYCGIAPALVLSSDTKVLKVKAKKIDNILSKMRGDAE